MYMSIICDPHRARSMIIDWGIPMPARWRAPETRQTCSPTVSLPIVSMVSTRSRVAMAVMVPTKPCRVHHSPWLFGNSGRPGGRTPPGEPNLRTSSLWIAIAEWYGHGRGGKPAGAQVQPHDLWQPMAEGSVFEAGRLNVSRRRTWSTVNEVATAQAASPPLSTWNVQSTAQ